MVIHALLERALFSLQLRAQVTWLRPGDSGCSALSAGEEDTQWHLPCSAVLRRGRGQSPRCFQPMDCCESKLEKLFSFNKYYLSRLSRQCPWVWPQITHCVALSLALYLAQPSAAPTGWRSLGTQERTKWVFPASVETPESTTGMRCQCAVSDEVRREAQGAFRVAPGNSGLHAHGKGERVIALEI